MDTIPLNPVPNQSIAFNLDGGYWTLHFFQSIDHMCVDISLNGQVLITGSRCFGGIPLLPYEYLQSPSYGNFIFDNEVDWTNFGTSCNLYYLEDNEFDQFELLLLLGAVVTA